MCSFVVLTMSVSCSPDKCVGGQLTVIGTAQNGEDE